MNNTKKNRDPESEDATAQKNPYENIFIVGDLNKLFLEPEEDLDEEIAEQNEELNRELLDRENYNDYDDEDYFEEDAGEDYGEEDRGEEYDAEEAEY